MKKILAGFLIWLISLAAYSQVLTGVVFSTKDKLPVAGASVFFNGTFAGTYTDSGGNFSLNISANANMPLTFSAIGYQTVVITRVSAAKPMVVHMQPKVFELKEVVVSDKDLSRIRKRYMRIFRDEFLGTTYNSYKTRILNEEDIKFIYDLKSDTIRAYSVNPLIIENNALGYKITYFLDEFEYDRKRGVTYFEGNILFNEDMTLPDIEKQTYEKNRQIAYLGSRMHFFRSLWMNDLDSSGYRIVDDSKCELTCSDIVYTVDDNLKFLIYEGDLTLFYNSEEPAGRIHFNEDEVNFDSNGYFNPRGIQWSGKISESRISDWLPYEYTPNRPSL